MAKIIPFGCSWNKTCLVVETTTIFLGCYDQLTLVLIKLSSTIVILTHVMGYWSCRHFNPKNWVIATHLLLFFGGGGGGGGNKAGSRSWAGTRVLAS